MVKHTRKPSEADHLAQILLEAYVAAWVANNPARSAGEWDHLKAVGCRPKCYEQVAEQLLARGVRPPATGERQRKRQGEKREAGGLFGEQSALEEGR